MNIYGKLLGWLVLAATPFFLVSCNDDDDNNSENKTVETPQLLELSDSKGDLMFYTYEAKTGLYKYFYTMMEDTNLSSWDIIL